MRKLKKECVQIRSCLVFISFLSFCFYFCVDFFMHSSPPTAQTVELLGFCLAIATLAAFWTGPLTILSGFFHSDQYKIWQPFEGGMNFVLVQAFGWTLYSVVLMLSVILLLNFHSIPMHYEGECVILGFAGFISQLLLNFSINLFKESDLTTTEFLSSKKRRRRSSKNTPNFVNGKSVVSLLISLAATITLVLYDCYGSYVLVYPGSVLTFAAMFFILSATIIHFFHGYLDFPNYKLWQPFEGNFVFLILQSFGWMLFSLMLIGVLSMPNVSADVTAILPQLKGIPSFIGICGFISQVLLLASLQHVEGIDGSIPPISTHSNFTKQKVFLQPGETFLGGLFTFIGAIFVLISYVLDCAVSNSSSSIRMPSHSTDFSPLFVVNSQSFRFFAFILLSVAVPLVHFGGVRTLNGYQWCQPFRGGTMFISFHAFGWLFYGVYLGFVFVVMINEKKMTILNQQHISQHASAMGSVIYGLGILAYSCIALSLPYFESNSASRINILSPVVNRVSSSYISGFDSRFQCYLCDIWWWWFKMNGEELVSLFLSVCTLFFHFSVDCYDWSNETATVMKLSGLLSCSFSCALLHFSGKRRYPGIYRLWQPFQGGEKFVLYQALGWTFYGTIFFVQALYVTIPAQSIRGIGAVGLSPGLASTLGVVSACLPQILLAKAIPHFKRDASYNSINPNHTVHQRKRSLRCKFFLLFTGCLSVVSSGMFFGCEWYCSGSSNINVATLRVSLLLAFGSVVISTVLIHPVCGRTLFSSSYQLWQPFQGGHRFVVFQAVGWTLFALGLVATSCTIYCHPPSFPSLVFVMIAGLFQSSQFSLIYSLIYFQPPLKDTSSCATIHPVNEVKSSKKRKYSHDVAFAVGIMSSIVLIVVYFVSFSTSLFPIVLSALVGLGLSMVPVCVKLMRLGIVDKMNSKKVKKRQNFNLLLQLVGSTIWSATLVSTSHVCFSLWQMDRQNNEEMMQTIRWWSFCTGTIAFFAQCLLFLAYHHTSFVVSNKRIFRHLCVCGAFFFLVYIFLRHQRKMLPINQQGGEFKVRYGLYFVIGLSVTIGTLWFYKSCVICKQSSHVILLNNNEAQIQLPKPFNQLPWEILVSRLSPFIQMKSLVQLSSTCRSFNCFYTNDLWYQLFQQQQFGTMCRKRLFQAPRVYSVQLFARNPIHFYAHQFLAPLCNTMCHKKKFPRLLPYPLLHQTKSWQVVCVEVERGSQLVYCQLCTNTTLISLEMLQYEQEVLSAQYHHNSTFVRPCAAHPTIHVHRACLEMKLQQDEQFFCDKCADSAPTGTSSTPITPTFRLCRDVWELIETTWSDPETIVMTQTVVFQSCSILAVLAPFGWGGGNPMMVLLFGVYLLLTTIVSWLVQSQAFDQFLDRIWFPIVVAEAQVAENNDDNDRIGGGTLSLQTYLRLYNYFMLSNFLILLGFSPIYDIAFTFVRSLLQAKVTPILWLLVQINSICYLVMIVGVLMVFWQNHYRLPTVPDLTPALYQNWCLYCRLHLCRSH